MKLKFTCITVLTIILNASCISSQTTYTILNNEDMAIKQDTFDIDSFEKNKDGANQLRITKDNGEEILNIFFVDMYLEYYTPPLPKLYTIYKEYYLNGRLKKKGYYIDELKIGKWEYYDEKGNKTIEDMDKQFSTAKYTYSQIIILLDQLGEINIKTGENRENVNLHYNKQLKQWYARIRNPLYGGNIYIINANNGEIFKKGEIISE